MNNEADDIPRRIEQVEDVEVVIYGDDSRTQLARRVVADREKIARQGIRLLESFMRDRGTFDLSSIEVFAAKTPNDGEFAIRFTFIADRDPHEYNYTYFDVFFLCHEPPQEPFWPFKFSVGFH